MLRTVDDFQQKTVDDGSDESPEESCFVKHNVQEKWEIFTVSIKHGCVTAVICPLWKKK